MRGALLALLAAAAACSPEPRRAFPVGFLEPVSLRVAEESRRQGLELAAQAPAGAAVVSSAVALKGDGEVAEDWGKLRFLTARAVAGGAGGVFFRLPSAPAGRDLLEYVEEWQAIDRVARELIVMRPILQGGDSAPAPFAVPVGMESRSWTYQGRRYALLVNASGTSLPLEERILAPWRALFAVRSDPRQVLSSCGKDLCLPAEGVLWLEGRLLPEMLP